MTRLDRAVLVSALVFALLGCGARSGFDETKDSPTAGSEHVQRFVGVWSVSSSGYAWIVRLGAPGTIEDLPSRCDYIGALFCSGELWFTPASTDPQPVACTMGQSWRSQGQDVLLLAARCDDGVERELAWADRQQASIWRWVNSGWRVERQTAGN